MQREGTACTERATTEEADMKWLVIAGLATAALVGVTGGVGASPTPYGTWTDHLTLNELYDKGFDPRMRGTYKLVLAKNGTYRWFHANSWDRWASGTLTVSGPRIVFAEDTACAEGGFTKKGFYRFAIKDGKLTFRATRGDTCGGRWQFLTYPIWKRA
jgi:hypothetical protein